MIAFRLIAEKAKRKGRTIYSCFVDFQTAFNSISHKATLWRVWTLPIDLLKNTNENAHASIRINNQLEIISILLRRIGIPLPTAPPGESLCIKTGNQIGGWVYSRLDHVIHGGPWPCSLIRIVIISCPMWLIKTHAHTQPFYGFMDIVWEETFTHSHLSWSSIVPYLLHLSTTIHGILPVQSMYLTVFFTISLQVFFGLPLGLAPYTSYSIHFFTQSLSSFRNTCPYHHNLFCYSTEIMSSNPSL